MHGRFKRNFIGENWLSLGDLFDEACPWGVSFMRSQHWFE